MKIEKIILKTATLGSIVIALFATTTQAAITVVGSYEIDAVYSENNTKLTVSVANTSGRRSDSMKCFSLLETVPGQFSITARPRSGWYFPNHASACGVFSSQFIQAGRFIFSVTPGMEMGDTLKIGYINKGGHRVTGTVEVSGNVAANQPPVANGGVSRVISDSDGFPGEQVLLNGSQSQDDKGISLYEWYIDNILVASGVTATVHLETNSSTVVELLVQDEEGVQDRDFVQITVSEPNLGYNGVTPAARYQLAYNNIAVYRPEDEMVYMCINMRAAESSESGLTDGKYNLNLRLSSSSPVQFAIESYSEFNPLHLLNEFGEEPDCSGQYHAATGRVVDIVQVGAVIGSIEMQIENSPLPILKVIDFEWLGLGQE